MAPSGELIVSLPWPRIRSSSLSSVSESVLVSEEYLVRELLGFGLDTCEGADGTEGGISSSSPLLQLWKKK